MNSYTTLRSSSKGGKKLSPILLCTTVVCLLASTIPLTTAAVNIAEFPATSAVPPVNHPQVQQWLSEIDLTGAPSIPLNVGDPPDCPAEVNPEACYWTCDDCSNDDVVECPDKNVWGLTFDDGPTSATPELLTFLDQQQVKATFFLIGGNVVQFPDMVVREAAAGHHLASHTWSHHALTTLSNEQIVAEIKWTEKAILDATGLRVRYMRPPYGDVDNRVRYVLKQLGYTVVDWGGDSFDSNDWKITDSGVSIEQVVSQFENSLARYAAPGANNTKGFISLEHDLNDKTVGVAKTLIPFGKQKNLRIMSVADCRSDSSPYGAGSSLAATTPPSVNNVASVPPVGISATSGGAPTADSNTGGSNDGVANGSGLDLNRYQSSTSAAGGSFAGLWSAGVVLSSLVTAGMTLL